MYSPLEYQDASENVKEIYNDIFEHLGNEGLIIYFKVLARHNPNILSATWNILKDVLLHGDLPRPLKELVFVAVSSANNCKYCTSIHSALCKILRVDDDTLNKVLTKSEDLNPKSVKLAIDFATKLALTPALITSTDHKILLDAGMNKSEIFELMSLASLVNYSNTLAQGMMIPVDIDIINFLETH